MPHGRYLEVDMSTNDGPGGTSPIGWINAFTTRSISNRNGFAAFREEFSIPFGGIEVSKLGERAFEVSVSTQQVGALACAKFVASPTLFKRTSKLMQDGDDSVFVLFANKGKLHVWQGDMRRDLLVGDIAIVCNSQERGGTVDGEGLAVQLPRASLGPLLSTPGRFAPATLPRDAAHTKLLLGYITSFLELTPRDDAHADALISQHVADLVALALGSTREAGEAIMQRGVRAARLHAIMADARSGVSARDLSVAAMARRHGVSTRYVQMLFEREGMTFSQFVLAERLAYAHKLLTDPRHGHVKVSDIAFQAGFSDLSYFNRAFRRRYGMTPMDARGYKRSR